MSLVAIKSLLRALNDGIDAKVVGVFDAHAGDIFACSGPKRGAFWEAFERWSCLNVDWGDWDRVLLIDRRARIVCGCGQHALEASVIHERWIFLLLADATLSPAAPGVVAHALRLLGDLLPKPRLAATPAAGPADHSLGWRIRRRVTH